jgi:hypothetical protein
MPHEGIDHQNFFGVILTAVIIIAVVVILSIAGCVYLAGQGIKAVHDKGAKNIATRIWEGPTNTPAK